MSDPILIGHRGAMAEITENTMASFLRAVDVGAAMVEFDVHLSADGKAVVIHDPTIDRVADESSPIRSGTVADLPWSALSTVVLRGGHAIPTLDEVLDGVGVPMLLEIKAPAAVEAVLAAVRGRDIDWALSRIISFGTEALARVRELAPALPIAPITTTVDEEYWALADRLRAETISTVHWESVPAAVVDRAHETGRTVTAGGLGLEDLALFRRIGIDGFCTDDPRTVADDLR